MMCLSSICDSSLSCARGELTAPKLPICCHVDSCDVSQFAPISRQVPASVCFEIISQSFFALKKSEQEGCLHLVSSFSFIHLVFCCSLLYWFVSCYFHFIGFVLYHSSNFSQLDISTKQISKHLQSTCLARQPRVFSLIQFFIRFFPCPTHSGAVSVHRQSRF